MYSSIYAIEIPIGMHYAQAHNYLEMFFLSSKFLMQLLFGTSSLLLLTFKRLIILKPPPFAGGNSFIVSNL